MIDNIKIANFKSHKETSLKVANLTVLAGQNGVGKSSFIQSLLLLRQTNQKNRLNKILDLNSPLCFIGKPKDAIYKFPNEPFDNKIVFSLSVSSKVYKWEFAENGNLSYLNRTNSLNDSIGFNKISLFTNNFQYLSASRNTEYLSDDYAVEIERQISIREGKGELVAQFLNKYGKNTKVIKALKHESEKDIFLLSQVIAWEREISNGVNINAIQIGNGYDIVFSFETKNELGPIDELSKQNVGFGLSYVLPLIVAILFSPKGSLLLIENPEAHIHPYGQSKLAELICLAAQAGIQIIVETHSDHIINGILLQCKKFEKSIGVKGIDKNNVKIYQFDIDETIHATIAKEVEIDTGGKIKNKPIGFFDQIGKDLRQLI